MAHDYDFLVIGAGSGGVRAARMAASYGAKVAIIEEYRVGGTCVIRGCVPKKLFVYASRFADAFELAESFGWSVDAKFDWTRLVANKDKEIDRLERAYVSALQAPGVEIIRDRAVVTGPHSLHLQQVDRELTARYILVATGSRPYVPAIAGHKLGITSNEAFHLPALPHSILIEGGGYIALEFASIFVGLGVHTTVVYRGDRVLRGFDEDLRIGVEAGMQARGVEFIYGKTITKLEQAGNDTLATFSDGVTAPYGKVMFATGRLPNVHGLGLETAGVELNAREAIAVDKFSQTSCPSIYAVGDVTARAQLTPVAIREGASVAETLFNDNPTFVDHSMIGSAVFAEPEVATIGLTETQAVERYSDIEIYLARFRPMIVTLSTKSERMMLKVITEKNGGRVLGVHVLGPDAAELVQMAAIPMVMGAAKADFDRAIAMHPTAAEELVTFKGPSYRYRDGLKQ